MGQHPLRCGPPCGLQGNTHGAFPFTDASQLELSVAEQTQNCCSQGREGYRILNVSDQPWSGKCLILLGFPGGEEIGNLSVLDSIYRRKLEPKLSLCTDDYVSLVLKRFLANGTGFALCRNGKFSFHF